MMLKRTAKSCRSDAPRPASSLREEARATVSNKPGHRGEREVSRKTIARGMPGVSGVTVVTNDNEPQHDDKGNDLPPPTASGEWEFSPSIDVMLKKISPDWFVKRMATPTDMIGPDYRL